MVLTYPAKILTVYQTKNAEILTLFLEPATDLSPWHLNRLFNLNEILELYEIELRKVYRFQNLVVTIIGDKKLCLTTNCTINKLIIIWICNDQIEMPCRRNSYQISAINEDF